MDWMEVLLLECQVAMQEFTHALEKILREKYSNVSCARVEKYWCYSLKLSLVYQTPYNIYACIIDAFKEYRFVFVISFILI